MKARIEWLDIAKGIGILLVVLGHCLNIDQAPFQVIFVFHMPLFMILSGYLYTDQDPLPALLQKKAKSLLVPFAFYFFLGLAVTLILPWWREKLTWQGIGGDLWLADPNAVHNSSIWFLAALFFVTLLFRGICRLPSWGQFLALLCAYCVGTWYSRARIPFLGWNRLPLDLDVVPVAIVFFALGYYANRGGFQQDIGKNWKYELAGAVLSGAGLLLVYRENGYVNMHGLQFGSAEMYLLGGILGTVGVVSVSCLISRGSRGPVRIVRKLLIWYGRHSLTILGLQSLAIRLYLEGMNHFFGKELQMYHFPIKHTVVCTALVGGVVCPMGCLAIDAVRKYRNKSKELAKL